MSKHTPGPWTRVPQSKGGDLIAREIETENQMNPKGLRLIAFMMSRGSSLAEDETNARLIAAAPEMVEMMETTPGFNGTLLEWEKWFLRRNALLARIEGDAP